MKLPVSEGLEGQSGQLVTVLCEVPRAQQRKVDPETLRYDCVYRALATVGRQSS